SHTQRARARSWCGYHVTPSCTGQSNVEVCGSTLQTCPQFFLRGRCLEIDDHCNVKLRVVFLDVPRPVLLPKFLHHRGDYLGIGDQSGLKFRGSGSGCNLNPGLVQQVLIPLRVRTFHRQQVKLVSLKHEPNRAGDGLARLPANDADRNFTIPRQESLKLFVFSGHTASAPRCPILFRKSTRPLYRRSNAPRYQPLNAALGSICKKWRNPNGVIRKIAVDYSTPTA